MQAADIDQYFAQYGWQPVNVRDSSWQVTFEGDRANFTIELELNADWVVFTIRLTNDGGYQPEKLLAANAQMWLTRFAIAPDGCLLLRADMPTEGFSYSHFVDCLGALSHYADLFYDLWH